MSKRYNTLLQTTYVLNFLKERKHLLHIEELERQAKLPVSSIKQYLSRNSKTIKPDNLKKLINVLRITFNFELSELPEFGESAIDLYKIVSKICKVKYKDLQGRSRNRELVEARYIAIYIYVKLTYQDKTLNNTEFKQIGKVFNYDRASIRHALYIVPLNYEQSKSFKDKLDTCKQRFAI